MNRTALRISIILLTLATAGIHLYRSETAGILFVLNGLGYLGLLIALLIKVPFLDGRERIIHYVFIGYTAVTILAWVAIGQKT